MIKPSNLSSKNESNTTIETHHRIDLSCNEQESPRLDLTNTPKKLRRRHIDPTTCERDYTIQEREFMLALDDYKRANGRMFPTCSEILEVIRNLGYVQYDMPIESAAPAISVKNGLAVS